MLEQFPLATVRRWACTALVVALDFGDHQDLARVYFTPKARYAFCRNRSIGLMHLSTDLIEPDTPIEHILQGGRARAV